jgi:hypothetical protein
MRPNITLYDFQYHMEHSLFQNEADRRTHKCQRFDHLWKSFGVLSHSKPDFFVWIQYDMRLYSVSSEMNSNMGLNGLKDEMKCSLLQSADDRTTQKCRRLDRRSKGSDRSVHSKISPVFRFNVILHYIQSYIQLCAILSQLR